jgi:hypothetical protein
MPYESKEQRNAYGRKRRELLKAQGLCTRCGKNPESPNKTQCDTCRLDSARRGNMRSPEYKKLDAVKHKKQRDALTKKGLCTRCGTNPKSANGLMCNSCRDAQNEKARIKTKELKIETFNAYSDGKCECYCCGEKHLDLLTLDHSRDDGKEHRKSITDANTGCGSVTYRELRKEGYPDKGLRVSCWSCNSGRALSDDGICPHVEQRRLAKEKQDKITNEALLY